MSGSPDTVPTNQQQLLVVVVNKRGGYTHRTNLDWKQLTACLAKIASRAEEQYVP